jgi:hypothetical protein
MTPSELEAERETMETWSQFCLDLLPGLIKNAEGA